MSWSNRVAAGIAIGVLAIGQGSVFAIDQTERYQVIVDRNAFGLKPYTPPPKPPPPPAVEKESRELKELDLKIAGVSVKGGQKRAWLAMMVPSDIEDEGPVRRFFPFKESDIHHGVTVKEISTTGDIQIEYDGKPTLLTFESHGTKRASNKKSPTVVRKGGKVPTRAVQTAATRRALVQQNAANQAKGSPRGATIVGRNNQGQYGNTANNPTATRSGSSPTLRTVRTGTGAAGSNPSLRTRTIPTRPVRGANTQQTPKLYNTREEQRALIEINRALAEQENRRLPPIPTLR